jgi:alpha-galactosidase
MGGNYMVSVGKRRRLFPAFVLSLCGMALPCFAQPAQPLAAVPPMGWNDWAHYQCHYTGMTILDNAHALVKTGLAKRGYDTVTIDDCWMQKDRDSHGNLQVDPQRFPHGMKAVADQVHALGLKFGIYEDAGYETCGRFAGSGVPKGGGKDHFVQDTQLFASWGVDYLKLDGCNIYVPPGKTKIAAYRKAYKAESKALKHAGRPIVFSESAPAYFQRSPEWYDVLTWVRDYGQLWREGSDIATFHASNPDRPRFRSVLWNYSYNLPLGRFQKPGNWNDADFIIGGDAGMSLAETRSQMALWSMMSAPLILSSDVGNLSPDAIAVIGNKAVIAIDQDPLGRMATLVRRTADIDVLFKKLENGYAVAVLNRSTTPQRVEVHPADLGFSAACRLDARNLWSGAEQHAAATLQAEVAPHDTAIWSAQAAASCGGPSRTGTITRLATVEHRDRRHRRRHLDPESYTRCLTSTGVEACTGSAAESWTVKPDGALESSGSCLAVANGKIVRGPCSKRKSERWRYTLNGTLISRGEKGCLTGDENGLSVQPCGHNLRTQVWSLPD